MTKTLQMKAARNELDPAVLIHEFIIYYACVVNRDNVSNVSYYELGG